MVKLKTREGVFTIDDYHWTGPDAGIVDYLNSRLSLFGPSGADPDPDYTEATAAMLIIGGEIIRHDEPDYEPGRIY